LLQCDERPHIVPAGHPVTADRKNQNEFCDVSRTLTLIGRAAVLPLVLLLTGCNLVVLAPSGDVAVQQRDLILISTALMLLIIIPVIVLTLLFAWAYRQSNSEAEYDPDWHHSTRLEVVIWSAPLMIILMLGAVTWISTHKLDPFRSIDRIHQDKPLPLGVKPLTVQVVALDWKWLFFYPDQGIATVNELAAPVDTPIHFEITSSNVMNSFFVPALAGQIYAMPGMQTQLHAVINHPGEFEGFSANYSGAGFSEMRFKFHGLSAQDFGLWAEKVKADGTALGRTEYAALAKQSIGDPVRHFSTVEDGLFNAILNMCAAPGKMCMSEMMHIDRTGGAGKESHENRERLIYDRNTEGNVMPAGGEVGEQEQQDHSMPGMDSGSSAPAQPAK
jgi:cytochrome o ubiquinol oxidase subunit II